MLHVWSAAWKSAFWLSQLMPSNEQKRKKTRILTVFVINNVWKFYKTLPIFCFAGHFNTNHLAIKYFCISLGITILSGIKMLTLYFLEADFTNLDSHSVGTSNLYNLAHYAILCKSTQRLHHKLLENVQLPMDISMISLNCTLQLKRMRRNTYLSPKVALHLQICLPLLSEK